MRVGVIGSGTVGQSFGSALVRLGHPAKVGSRDPKSAALTAWVSRTGSPASVGTFAEAAAFGEVVVLATLGTATGEAIDLAGPANFTGKVVIDITNPLVMSEQGTPRLSVGFTDSLGEQNQRRLPDARVVKAFNSVGAPHFFRPSFPGGPPTMFFCGNDLEAKATVSQLIADFGWVPLDTGGIEMARAIEPLCILWVTSAMKLGSFDIAFQVLRK